MAPPNTTLLRPNTPIPSTADSTKRTVQHDSNTRQKVIRLDNMNAHIRNVEYAVRGELAIKAETLKKQLNSNKSLPFETIVNCNIGNPQQLEQKPITFFRQVASLCDNPDLLLPEARHIVSQLYPRDAIERAELLLQHIGSVGAYSHSQGIPHIRENVAKFISERDGYPTDPENIYLTQGASAGVQSILSVLTADKSTGILIPTPQYPLYSATLSLLNATPVPYLLDESQGWSLNVQDLGRNVSQARANGTDVRALCIINPGNPTGQCLSEGNMREIIEFCYTNRIVLLADEVYQTNIYDPEARPFHSFKKVLMSMDQQFHDLELVSFHSISKGMIGECGRRGGYFECHGIDKDVMGQLYKVASVSLCPNVHGQILVDLMCQPPKQGEPSYEKYSQEIGTIYSSLRRRSKKLEDCFNSMEAVTCNAAYGAMYLFPQIRLPAKAIAEAESQGKIPDNFYCLQMLDATGVCVVPGSGFGQKEGTWHFRSTFLPPEHLFDSFCEKLTKFHSDFMNQYRD
ncbi:alanine transaminase, variant 2 [Umbelopsis sp. WA50703]